MTESSNRLSAHIRMPFERQIIVDRGRHEHRRRPRPPSWALAWLMLGAAAGCAGTAGSDESLEPIRIGTSGDHAPYSQLVGDRYIGIDIDLARDLARTVGRRPEFVRFQWSTLPADVVEGRFDVALSGIAVSESRAAIGIYSEPYLTVGHQAVVRCHEVTRFAQLDDANRTSVTVLVARGTTENEFARERLPNATTVSLSSGEVFDRMAAGVGDITFANTLRALYAVRRNPTLCSGFDGVTFDSIEVAAYMPPGSPYKNAVDPWLMRRTHDGFIARLVEAHLEVR